MRIAFLADPLDRQYGGIHVYTREILRALAKVDQQNEYLVVRSEHGNELAGMEEIVVPYAKFPGYRFWRLFFQLPRLLVEKEVDMVVEPAHFGPFNLPAHIRRVTVIHDVTVFTFPQHHVFFSQLLQRIFLPGILRRADHILTNSASTAGDLNKLFPATTAKTTPVLLGKGRIFQPGDDASILRRYHLTQPYLLYVGTLEPRKNIGKLVRAFNDFKSATRLPHQLVIAGKKGWKSGPIFREIAHSAYKNDIITPGYVPDKDLPFLYSQAELFVYPSVYEGFGLPVLEAMACGTPVITSNVSSLPEVGGEAVTYFSPASEKELAEKMAELCGDPELRARNRERGLVQAAKFNWERAASETAALFHKLADRS